MFDSDRGDREIGDIVKRNWMLITLRSQKVQDWKYFFKNMIFQNNVAYHSLMLAVIFLVSPSNDTTISPPGSPILWAAGKEPKKLTSPIVVRNPWSIPRLCHVTSATWCDTNPRVKATNFSVSYQIRCSKFKMLYWYICLLKDVFHHVVSSYVNLLEQKRPLA